MLEERRIKSLEKRNKQLQEDNKLLNERVNELETRITNMQSIVDAADTYAEEHNKQMLILNEARQRYELAYKQMIKIKKEYEKRMENVLKGFE